jgi:hypothetical protein
MPAGIIVTDVGNVRTSDAAMVEPINSSGARASQSPDRIVGLDRADRPGSKRGHIQAPQDHIPVFEWR